MGKFVLLYSGGMHAETEEEIAKVMAKWMTWYGGLGDKVVDPGNPLGPPKAVMGDGVSEDPADSPGTTGYTIITADSLDDAVASVTNHPHIGFGGQVHVYEAFDM